MLEIKSEIASYQRKLKEKKIQVSLKQLPCIKECTAQDNISEESELNRILKMQT